MAQEMWLLAWLVAWAAAWLALPRDRGRMLFLSLVMAAGHALDAAGPNGRDHWLHSFHGDYRALLQLLLAAVALAPLACRQSLPDTRPLAAWKKPGVILYASLALLGTGFGYLRRWDAINFSMKAEHLRAATPTIWAVLATGAAVTLILLVLHMRQARRQGEAGAYLFALAAAAGVVVLATWWLKDTHYLHIHHSVWSLALVLLFRYAPWYSRYPQALALGIYIDGIVSWGLTGIWHAVP